MIDFRTITRGSRWLKTPFAPSLKLFALNLKLVPLFETFSQLSSTAHKTGTSVTAQLDHLAATIYESCKTHYKIWMNRTCVRTREQAAPTFHCTPSKLDVQGAKKLHSGEGKGRLIRPSCDLSEEVPFVESMAWHEISCRQYIG